MATQYPRLPISGAHQMTLRINQNGQEAVVVLGCTSPTGTGMNQAKAEQWRNAAWNHFRALMLTTCVNTGAIVRDVSGPDATVYELGPVPTNAAGSATGTPAAAATASLIKWSTATGGRTGKGRTYIPGLPTTAIHTDGRTYTSVHATAVTNIAQAYVADPVWSVDWKPAVLSFRRGLPRPITAGACAAVVGLQRRRMRA